jgi:hypothetical protein
MAIIDKKKKIFGKIAAARTLTEGLPSLKTSSSFPSINNNGDSITFLTDLIKSLVGYEVLVEALVDTLINSLPKIEKEIKNVLKVELKTIVSCGVDPNLPNWFKSTGDGIIIEVKKIDFADILRTDPNSIGGSLIYSDITQPFTDSSDFNTFLYGVIQDDGVTYTWNNIIDVTFNSLGTNGNPNNTITIKANPSYNSKTLTDVNNDFINSISLFNTENVVNKTVDLIYGSISSTIGKSLKQLKQEAQINGIVDKMINNVNKNPIDDSAFSFSNIENYAHELEALNKKQGIKPLEVGENINSSVPIDTLNTFNQTMSSVTSIVAKTNVLTQSLNAMANDSALNVPSLTDIQTVKLDFIQQIISNLIKGIISILLSPKIILSFVLNYKIVYGPNATFTDAIDFIKKNKNLTNSIMKAVSQEIISILTAIALKEIAALTAAEFVKRQKEKNLNRIAQLESLIGIPTNNIKSLLDSL